MNPPQKIKIDHTNRPYLTFDDKCGRSPHFDSSYIKTADPPVNLVAQMSHNHGAEVHRIKAKMQQALRHGMRQTKIGHKGSSRTWDNRDCFILSEHFILKSFDYHSLPFDYY